MRRSRASLGLKLNLALLLFFIVLGGATAAFVFAGFNRTRDNATALSEEALEDLGADVLQYIAYTQADYGAVAMEWASELGHRASRYMEQFKDSGATASLDISRFVQTTDGIWYDPDPDRVSDVVVPNHTQLEGAVLDDVTYSAALDALFPALIEGFPGEFSGEAYYPIAIIFIGANSVGRYYPPIGIQGTTPADFDASYLIDKFGPVINPERQTLWTTPYEDLNGRGLVITAQTPIYEDDVFRGIFEVDLSISKLVEVVNQIKPTENGFAFYVDKEGEILRTEAYDLLTAELGSGSNQDLDGILERMKLGEPGVDHVRLGGREFFLASAPMAQVGGGFAVVAPISELTANASAITAEIDDQADRTMLIVLGSMTAMFGVALVGATYLNRRVLIRPIEALVAGTHSVAAGDLEVAIPSGGEDELGLLARSFNDMTGEIRSRRQALEQEVRDRRAAEDELQALVSSMTDSVVVIDRDGRYLRVPQTNAPGPFAAPPDLAGQTMWDVMPQAQADGFMDTIGRALASQTTETTEYAIELYGREYWFSAAVSPMSPDAVVVVARDITERINARQELERQVKERTRELTTLLSISSDVASMLEVRPLLALVIERVKTIADYDRCSIYILDGDRLTLLDSRGATGEGTDSLGFPVSTFEPIASRIVRREPVIINDIGADGEEALAYQRASGKLFDAASSDTHSWMAVPLALKDRIIGMLTLSHKQSAFYTEHHASLVGAIAIQIAVAIENARLYEQAQQLAAVEERQRLARELHDSVSQALYGIALGARTARTLLDADPARAIEPTDYVLQLAEAGLAEMRALIFELRPESLETEGLVAALEKQIAATRARYGIEVETDLCEEPTLTLVEKEVLYRVAQEALHNVVKHAHATRAELRLSSDNGSVVLEIRDEGTGFDTSQSFPGHMGLISMRERATSLGGSFDVESSPGLGTRVRLSLPVA